MRLQVRLARLWRTVRHLRRVQFTGRLRFKLQRPQPDLRPAPAQRQAVATWATPARRPPSLVGPWTMRYLGQQRSLGEVGWDAPEVPLLWRYMLPRCRAVALAATPPLAQAAAHQTPAGARGCASAPATPPRRT